jgi:hypothetical protein
MESGFIVKTQAELKVIIEAAFDAGAMSYLCNEHKQNCWSKIDSEKKKYSDKIILKNK